MAFYTARPQTVEAIQWTGDNLAEINNLIWVPSPYIKATWDETMQHVQKHGLCVDIDGIPTNISIGDYIIQHDDSTYEVMDSADFELNYD